MNLDALRAHVAASWAEALPTLHEYITVPNVSVAFDPDWQANGHMDRAVDIISRWCRRRAIAGLEVEVHRLPGRTPVIVLDVPATDPGSADDPVLLYGHLDKQPPMDGWADGLGPWTPVTRDDRLYGRGGADDGYAAFAVVGALEALRAAGGRHRRCVVIIEASEESGSCDLPAHVAALTERIGSPSLVVCLDSGCLDYARLWLTTSLRGLIGGVLTVEVVTEGLHSGNVSGVVPSSFRIARSLLSRLEDERTGTMLLDELHVDVPPDRLRQARTTAAEIGHVAERYPLVAGARSMHTDATDQLLARTWAPALSVTGADGLPATGMAGNVLRPATSLKVSIRIPPTCDPAIATDAVTTALTANPPYGAQVRFEPDEVASGWNAPPFADWLATIVESSSTALFGKPAQMYGEGGTIPFMAMLGARFPEAQFLITGVLGPDSNAHGPNEYLHLPTAERLTAAVAMVLDAHASR